MNRFLSALLLFLAASCATPSSSSGPPAETVRSPCEYYPLAVGNRWVYEGVQAGGASGAAPEEIPVTITGVRGGFFIDDHNSQWACSSDGLRDDKRSVLRSPIDVGQHWTAVVGVGSTERIEIISVGAQVVVPAGTFTETVTVQIQQRIDENKTLVNEMTFARLVGPIRIATKLVDSGREVPQIEARLRSFQAAPAPPTSATAQ